MASSHFLCSHQHQFILPSSSSFSKSNLSSFKPYGSLSFKTKIHFSRTQLVKCNRKVEITYDPDERLNKLADQLDKEVSHSRLRLFSPCRVISLGDTIKFSLSPMKTKDRLSTNVPGIPLDDKNLIIKALNLYRTKTCSDNFFWDLVVEPVIELLHFGQQINSMVVLPLRRNSKNGQVRLVQIFPSFSPKEQLIALVEVVQDIPPPIPLDVPMVNS